MSEKEKEREREKGPPQEVERGFGDLEEAMKEMILNYLLIHCYDQTAKAFVLSGRVGDSLKASEQHTKKKAKLEEGKLKSDSHAAKKGPSLREREAEMEVDQDISFEIFGGAAQGAGKEDQGRASPRDFGLQREEQFGAADEALVERQNMKEKEKEKEKEREREREKERQERQDVAMDSLLKRAEFQTISHRKILRKLIMDRKIEEAIRECNQRFPGMLGMEGNFKEVLFLLQSQHFVEMIRAKAPTEVLFRFAQVDLAPFGFLGPSYLDQLRDLIALSATESPEGSPVGGYLDPARLEHVWETLNLSILEFCKSSVANSIERIVRQTTVVSEILSNEPGVQQEKWLLENMFNDKMTS